jgi:hypothetical protein
MIQNQKKTPEKATKVLQGDPEDEPVIFSIPGSCRSRLASFISPGSPISLPGSGITSLS